MATRYVATTGNDSTGTGTLAAPWLTLLKALNTAAVGDIIEMRGGTYANTFKNGRDTVTIQNYPGENVIIQRTTAGGVLQLENARNITIRKNPLGGSFTVRSTLTSHTGGSSGVFVYRDASQPGFVPSNILIDGVIVESISGYGIQIADASAAVVQNVDVSHCGTGIRFRRVTSASFIQNGASHHIDRMIVSDSTSSNDNGGTGISLDACVGVTVQGMQLYENHAVSVDYGVDGGAVELFESSSCVIQNNTAYNNNGFCETGTGNATTHPMPDNMIRRNTVYGKMSYHASNPGNFVIVRAGTNLRIYNNTVDVDDGDACIYVQGAVTGYSAPIHNLKVKNNIFVVRSSTVVPYKIYNVTAMTGIEIDYNLLYKSTGGGSTFVDANNYGAAQNGTGLATWRANSPFSDHDIWNTDPLFTDRTARNYVPLSGSPAINAGVVISGTTDGYLGSAPDMGRYEPVASSVTRYISPTGSDTTGTGTISAPWRTIKKACESSGPGDTVLCRGGTYQMANLEIILGASGSSTAPITVKPYPGETPLFSGAANSSYHFLRFQNSSWITVEDLSSTTFFPDDSGAIVIIGNSQGITLRRLTVLDVRDVNAAPGTHNDHVLYISEGATAATSPRDILIEHCRLEGASSNPGGRLSGGGIHMFHDPGGARVVIRDNLVRRCYWGFIAANTANDTQVIHNTFVDVEIGVEIWAAPTNVLIRDNLTLGLGTLPLIWANVSNFVENYNYWSQNGSFATNVYWYAGSTRTPAGWISATGDGVNDRVAGSRNDAQFDANWYPISGLAVGTASDGLNMGRRPYTTASITGSAGLARGWSTAAVGKAGVTGTVTLAKGWSTAVIGTQGLAAITGTSASTFRAGVTASGKLGVAGLNASAFGWSTAGVGKPNGIIGTSTFAKTFSTAATATQAISGGVTASSFRFATSVVGMQQITGTSATSFTMAATGSGIMTAAAQSAASAFRWETAGVGSLAISGTSESDLGWSSEGLADVLNGGIAASEFVWSAEAVAEALDPQAGIAASAFTFSVEGTGTHEVPAPQRVASAFIWSTESVGAALMSAVGSSTSAFGWSSGAGGTTTGVVDPVPPPKPRGRGRKHWPWLPPDQA